MEWHESHMLRYPGEQVSWSSTKVLKWSAIVISEQYTSQE